MKSKGLSNLEVIKRDLMLGKDRTTERFVMEVVRAIDNNLWCYFPVIQDPRGTRVLSVQYQGKIMIAAYSSDKSRKVAADMICTDINKMVDVLYSNKECSGFVFDLEDGPIVITRKTIDYFTKRKDPRLQNKDWGIGIPEYTDEDIMTDAELYDFAITTIVPYIEKEGYSIVEVINDYRSIVNIIAEKNKKKYYISVKVDVAPNHAKLNKKEIERLKEICKNEKAIPLFAPTEFGSTDEERFKASLTLVGDGFYCNYTGLKKL